MSVTVVSFRQSFKGIFDDAVAYPDIGVSYWLGIAGLLLNTARFGVPGATAVSPPTCLYDFATELFVAHNLALEKRARDAAAAGSAPGLSSGVVSSESVGGVSVGYDASAGLVEGAAHWNLTTYGVRFIMLARACGAGPVQIGQGYAPEVGIAGAWPGPLSGIY